MGPIDDDPGGEPSGAAEPKRTVKPKAKAKGKAKGLLEVAVGKANTVKEAYNKHKGEAAEYAKLMKSNPEWTWAFAEYDPLIKDGLKKKSDSETDFTQVYALSSIQQVKKRYSDQELATNYEEFLDLIGPVKTLAGVIGELVAMKYARDEAKRKTAAANTPTSASKKRRV